MTKERKLAIAMWEYIRDNYDRYDEYAREYDEEGCYDAEEDALCELKRQFLKGKNVKWAMSCWFCQYIGHRGRSFNTYRCGLCPLQSCETGPYCTLARGCTQIQYIDACNQIIEALGGDV